MVHAYNPNTGEAEAGESRAQGQPRLYSKTMFQKTKTTKKKCHIISAFKILN